MVFWTLLSLHNLSSSPTSRWDCSGLGSLAAAPWRLWEPSSLWCRDRCDMEHVPLGSATQSVWPWHWVTIPGEVWLCRWIALLAQDQRKAYHVRVSKTKLYFRFVIKGDCDILGTPLRLGWAQTLPASQESVSEPEFYQSHSYRSCYILTDFSSSLCCFSHSVRFIGWGSAWGSASNSCACSLSGPLDLGCAGRSWQLCPLAARCRPQSQPALWLFLWAEGSSHSCYG